MKKKLVHKRKKLRESPYVGTKLKEAADVFPYLGGLIERLTLDYKRLTLDEKCDLAEKIGQELDTLHDLVTGMWQAQQKWLRLSEETQKKYREHRKRCKGEPLMKTGLNAQRWCQEQLAEQRFNFAFKEIKFQLENMDLAQTRREMEALIVLTKYHTQLVEKVTRKLNQRMIKDAVKIAWELRKRGLPVTKVTG